MATPLKIKYVGKTHEAPAFLMNAARRIEMPENQSKPFEHESASEILKAFPGLYKKVLPRVNKPTAAQETPNLEQTGETSEV